MASTSGSERAPGQRQQFNNALEKYATIFSLSCNHAFILQYGKYAFKWGILQWLVAYGIIQMLIGIPILMLELFIGQFSSSSIISLYSVAPAHKGAGIMMFFIMLSFLGYGVIEVGRNLVLLAYTFTMPWTHCNNSWNSPQCRTLNLSQYNASDEETKKQYSDEQFVREMINGSDSVFLWWIALAIIVVWVLAYFVTVKGVRIMGKVALWSVIYRIVTTIILLIVGLSAALPLYGGNSALLIYFQPSDSIYNINLWGDAVKHALMHQSWGIGLITTIGSYNKLRNNCLIDSAIVAGFNTLYPFMYGILHMTLIGFLSSTMAIEPTQLFYEHFELGKMTLPLSLIPGNFLWVFLYVLMTVLERFGIYMVLLELITTSLMDEYPNTFVNRQRVVLGICAPLIILSFIMCIGNDIGRHLFFHFDFHLYLATWSNLSMFIYTFAYYYGAGRIVRDIRHILPKISWAVTWPCYLSWIVLIPFAYASEYAKFYAWISVIGHTMPTAYALHHILVSTIYAVVFLIRAKGTFVQRLALGFKPSVDWGPSDPEDKLAWEEYSKKQPICFGCAHPDCCTTNYSSELNDIPLSVEVSSKTRQRPSLSEPSNSQHPITESPGENNPQAQDNGLYTNLPSNP